MLIFWRLMLGHLLADFTFQTNFINRWKRSSIWGMIAHCAMHPVVYAVLTWPYLADPWIAVGPLSVPGWACILLIFVGHFAEDQWRVFTIFKYKTPDNFLYFAWDQIIHYAVIFAVIPLGLRNSGGSLVPEAWPVLGCLFVIVTHATTVIVYFVEKDAHGRGYPDSQEKYLSMIERLVLALAFLLPGGAWLLAFGWAGVMYRVRAKRYLDLSWYSFYIGGVLAALCGLAARIVYYA
jgi:hypothetical protein